MTRDCPLRFSVHSNWLKGVLQCKVISRNFVDRIDKMETAFATLSGRPEETHLYHHYQEQIQDFKGELGTIRQNVLSMNIEKAWELLETISELDKMIHDVSIRVKGFLYPSWNHWHCLERMPPSMETFSIGAPSGSSFTLWSMIAHISPTLRSLRREELLTAP